MKISEQGLQLIKHFEGFRNKAYQDIVGVWTIGYGCTHGVKAGMTIIQEQGEAMLMRELNQFERAVDRLVIVDLNQNQFDALVSFAYNLGVGSLQTSTLLKRLNAGDYVAVPAQMLRWNKAGVKEAAGLTRRREAEGVLFATGKLQI